ncbi:cyclin-O [Cheilinus undulatus]|uniref:cyclin-O n=1 Tax=Cheilinus undulatus TaxID=241271 RepID=UPI001BD4A6A0|nr:cyclin-O [Cheilinus undulatus]
MWLPDSTGSNIWLRVWANYFQHGTNDVYPRLPGRRKKGALQERGRSRERDVSRRISPHKLSNSIQDFSMVIHCQDTYGLSENRLQREVADMVSFEDSETVYKRRRTTPTDALTPLQQRHAGRLRKQKLVSKMSDSGFEEDLRSSPVSSLARVDVSLLRSDGPPAGELSTWYLQYGDIGYRIQREREVQFHPCKSLARQPELTAEARCKLVSWLIPVHKHFCLSFECCCLAVSIMDRFLASTPVASDCFQLLGVTALLLASKQVEVGSPQISHLLSFCCDAFTKEQLCNLECLILLRLNFRLSAPTLAFFLDYYTNCIEAAQLACAQSDRFGRVTPDTKRPRQCSNLAQKVCELSLADYAFNKYPPSLTACCALRLASELLKHQEGVTECADMQPPEDQLGSLMGELFTQSATSNCSQFQECRDNLKLLVSLNQEALDGM